MTNFVVLLTFIEFYYKINNMKDIKELVAQNLISLRKQNNLTQVELSEKINYSDKAISRWEKGEVLPSLEILQDLAYLYNVPISYFLEEHPDNYTKKLKEKTINIYTAIMLMSVLVIWTISIFLFFVLAQYKGVYYTMCFIWPIPITAFTIQFVMQYFIKSKYSIIPASIGLWTLLASLYLQNLSLNLWPIYLLGIPIQITIILSDLVKKIRLPKIKKGKNKKSN